MPSSVSRFSIPVFMSPLPKRLACRLTWRRWWQAGLTHVVLEATSHGLAQQRVAACEFDMGVVTNITHEHLDYHGSYEAYRAAKGLLFEGLSSTALNRFQPPRGAVLNRDDGPSDYLSGSDSMCPVIELWAERTGRCRAQDIAIAFSGLSFTARGRDLDGGDSASRCAAVWWAHITFIIAWRQSPWRWDDAPCA